MKKAKFAPVTAALLARKEGTCLRDGHVDAAAVFPSHSLGLATEDFANDKSAAPLSTIDVAPTGLRSVTLRLSQSDCEHLNQLMAAKRDAARQSDSPDNGPHFANGHMETGSAQIVSKWVWLKELWSGFQTFGHGPRW